MGSFLFIFVVTCLAQGFITSAAPQNVNLFTPTNTGSLLPGFPGGGIFPPAPSSAASALNLLNPFSGLFNPAPPLTAPTFYNPLNSLGGLLSPAARPIPAFNIFNPVGSINNPSAALPLNPLNMFGPVPVQPHQNIAPWSLVGNFIGNFIQIPSTVFRALGVTVANAANVATAGIATAVKLVLNIPAILQSVAAPIFTVINNTLNVATTAIYNKLNTIISIVGGIKPSYFNGQILPILNKAADDLKSTIIGYQTTVMQVVSGAVTQSSTILSATASQLTAAADSANAQVAKVTVKAGTNAALCLNNLKQKINTTKQAEYSTVETCISVKLIQIKDIVAAVESGVTTKLNAINSVYTQCMATPTLAMIGSYCEIEFTTNVRAAQIAIDSLYKIGLADIQSKKNELSTCAPATIPSTLSTVSIQAEIDICKAKTG